jgi:hypothetical protein
MRVATQSATPPAVWISGPILRVEVMAVTSSVALLAVGFGLVLVWLVATAVARWWSSSLTVVVARARLAGWCAVAGRFLRSKLPAALSPLAGGRVLPTVGSVPSTADPTVTHRGGAV